MRPTSRQRILLSVAGVLLLLAAGRFSFSPVLDLRARVQANEARLAATAGLEDRIAEYEALAAAVPERPVAGAEDRQRLFEEINTFCRQNDLQIVRFQPGEAREGPPPVPALHRLEVRGDFAGLVHLAWRLERETRLARVASAEYRMNEDRRTGAVWLGATFFLSDE